MNNPNNHSITGLLLAGGQASRMGGIDKGLVDLAGRPLIEWVLAAMAPQTADIIINANRSQTEYAAYGHTVIADSVAGYCGPLAGIAAGLAACNSDYLATCPCDSPLVPTDLVRRLYDGLQAEQAEIAVAHNGERLQPVFALLTHTLLDSLRAYLEEGGRKIDRWYAQHQMVVVDFSDRPEAFLNINTPEDVATLTDRLSQQQDSRDER